MHQTRPRSQAPALVSVILVLLLTGCAQASGSAATETPGKAAQAQAQTPITPTVAATMTPSPATPAASPTTTAATTTTASATQGTSVSAQTGQPADVTLATAVRHVADTRKPGVVLISVGPARVSDATRPSPEQGGIGSGAIIDAAGHIVTNNHVIEGGGQIEVVLPDGRRFPGNLVGRDPRTDLAVVKIEGNNLPVVPLAPKVNVAVGDWVVAIGNALGLPGGPTVTAGVVGALGRTIEEPNGVTLVDLIQTDAAINPGNSGGPLLNLNGELVGINTAGIQGASGLGFAVSVDTVNDIVPQLMQHGKVIRPFIGIGTQAITPGIAARFDLPADQGLLIVQVVPNSPAAQAGLQEGDIIRVVDGQQIKTEADLQAVLRSKSPGDTITLTVLRNGNEQQVQVKLAEAPAPQ